MVFSKLAHDVRYHDPAIGNDWPIAHASLSEWDVSYPDMEP
jgi:dTDP-4-dehydrorhamnose 3,5-epimerase-like enzyme